MHNVSEVILLFMAPGMSLSVLKVDDPILNALDSPTKAPSWPVGVCGTVAKPIF